MRSFVKVVWLFFGFCLQNIVEADYSVGDESLDKGSSFDRGKMWFGPRLGKRSAFEEADKSSLVKLLEAADNLQFYYDQLQADEERPEFVEDADDKDDIYDQVMAVKKGNTHRRAKSHPGRHTVIFTPKLGRSLEKSAVKRPNDFIAFTPRLGRRLADSFNPSDNGRYHIDNDQMYPGQFMLRYNRNVHFTPRLGRQIQYDEPTNAIRVARSVNKTKSDNN